MKDYLYYDRWSIRMTTATDKGELITTFEGTVGCIIRQTTPAGKLLYLERMEQSLKSSRLWSEAIQPHLDLIRGWLASNELDKANEILVKLREELPNVLPQSG